MTGKIRPRTIELFPALFFHALLLPAAEGFCFFTQKRRAKALVAFRFYARNDNSVTARSRRRGKRVQYKETEPDGTAVRQADRDWSGGEHRESDRMALQLRLRRRDRCENRASPGGQSQVLRLLQGGAQRGRLGAALC